VGHPFCNEETLRMKKLVMTLFGVVVAGSTVLGILASTAKSRPQYYAQFQKMYVKSDGSQQDQDFAKEVKDAKCQVCHAPGKDRKLRNSYGKELAKVINPDDATGFKGERDKTKIDEALKKVADMHVDPNDSKSPTYGELIKEGKLPGGEAKAGENK
jgi:uncharacterized protein YxeA